MIDNVYELKQRFVGFNKVKLLTVVFYCMAYSWCSFLTEYNASEEKNKEPEEEKEEEKPKKEKGKWTLDEDAVVYKCDTFTVTYTWDESFGNFISPISQDSINKNNNPFPAGFDRASDIVGFLYRYQDILGIRVGEEVAYDSIKSKELSGCCTSCCNGKLENEKLFFGSTRKEKILDKRIFSIGLRIDSKSNAALEKWMGDISAIPIVKGKKIALLAIANLFDQEGVVTDRQDALVLSEPVQTLISKSPGYTKVQVNDVISLKGVIAIKKDEVKVE